MRDREEKDLGNAQDSACRNVIGSLVQVSSHIWFFVHVDPLKGSALRRRWCC